MKLKNVNLERSEILGRKAPPPSVGAADVHKWRRGLGYLSMFAGVAAVIASQTSETAANETARPIPPRVAKQAAELVKQLKSGACSKPDLLRRQSEYRLQNQKAEFNMVELLAGADNCPGTPIPAGTYTVATPFTDSGNTNGANNTVTSIPAACNGYYAQVAGPDHIYSFQISARGGNPQIRATTTTSTYDMSIYILDGTTGAMCPAGPGATVTNCLVGADNTLAPGAETIGAGLMGSLPLNTPLYLFIDSFYGTPPNSGAYTVTMQDVTVGGGPMPPANDAPVDLNADGKTDFVVIRNIGGGPSGQVRWYTAFQAGDPTLATDWGIATDEFISDDYDGDGKDDFAVYRQTNATFYIVRSLTHTLHVEAFGAAGDDPTVVGDYDGDGKADLALYRDGLNPGDQSFWYYRPLGGGGFTTIPWGQNGDTPAPGDYDGDGKNDFVIQRDDPNGVNGRFFKRMNSGGQTIEIFGLKTDSVVPGDYDGDGKTDIAVARNDGGFIRWDFEPSGTAGTTVVTDLWGVTATDFITQGDYDGDGKTEYAVWREGNPGRFFMMTPVNRAITMSGPWGQVGDRPVAGFNTH